MYNIYGVTFVFITSNILLSSIEALPFSKDDSHKSIYDVLLERSNKCPYLKTIKLLTPKPTYLDYCSEFSKIKSITNITLGSGYDISCLLYVNNIISLCNSKVNIQQMFNNESIDLALKSYNLAKACDILQKTEFIPELKNGEDIMNLFKKPEVCNKICSEITSNEPTPICSLAALSFIVKNSVPKVDKVNTSIISNTKQVQNAPAPKQENPPKPKTQETSQHTVPDIPKKKVESQPPDQIRTVPAIPQQPNPQQQNVNVKPEKKNQSESHSDVQKPIVSLANIEVKKTESLPPKQKEPPQEVESKNEKGHEAEPVEEEEPYVEKVGNTKASTPEQNIVQQSPVQSGEHIEQSEEGKPIEESPKSDKNEDQKSSPQGESSAKDNTDMEPSIPENEDTDDIGIDQETDAEEAVKSPPVDTDKTSKGETEGQDTKKTEKIEETNAKPKETEKEVILPSFNNSSTDEEDSFFFIYFMMVCAVFILGYIGYHNKQKVLALVIEGRRGRRGSRRGRPNSANYHKLDSNLEEAVTSSCNKNTTNIIY